MTIKQLELIDELKGKIKELNLIIIRINETECDSIDVNIHQEEWHPMSNSKAVANKIEHVACVIREVNIY